MPDMIFRRMAVGDLDAVHAIEKVCFLTPWSKESIRNEIQGNDCAYYLVAMLDGRIVAYGGFWRVLDEAHITNIAVAPLMQRRGVGEGLLTRLMQDARDMGARSMTLEVRRSNLPAQALYLKMNFKVAGVRRGYYSDTREDALIMWNDRLAD